jgi:hypothetical protein
MGIIEVSTETSRTIYEDGMAAFRDPGHPCHPFVRWQAQHGCPDFQLPEPFSGRGSSLGLVFVGLNPGFTEDEPIPTAGAGASFEDYDSFYRERFDDKNRDSSKRILVPRKGAAAKPGRFWNAIERFGRACLVRDFRLGEHALLIEVIRYKSKHGWTGDNDEERDAIAEHERRLTRALLEDLRPKVIVTAGRAAL